VAAIAEEFEFYQIVLPWQRCKRLVDRALRRIPSGSSPSTIILIPPDLEPFAVR
jgi:hypothetical protein